MPNPNEELWYSIADENAVLACLKNGADANYRIPASLSYSWAGWTFLTYAVYKHYTRIAQILLENQADPNLPVQTNDSWNNWGALACAVYYHYNDLTEKLLNRGANTNILIGSKNIFYTYESFLTTDTAIYYWLKGNCYFYENKFQLAYECYQNIIKKDQNNAFAYYASAKTLYNLNREQEAISLCNQAINLNHDVAIFYCMRALISSDLNYKKLALSDYETSITFKFSGCAFFLLTSVVLYYLQRYDEA